MSKIFSALFLLCLLPCAWAQPNFVVIVSDDMGWTGSSVQMSASIAGSKSDYYLTPSLEAMAQAGMTFSQAYAPAPKCAPSRCSILTGKSTAKTKFTITGSGLSTGKLLSSPATEREIAAADISLPEWLAGSGQNYRSAHYGKWHLSGGGTASHGFDAGDGETTNADGDNAGGVAQNDPKKIFELTNKAISFIQSAKNDGAPFYVQLSHYAVHTGIEAKQETIDLYNDPIARPSGGIHDNAEYGAMTEDMDTGIGMLLDELTHLGLDSNTYVVFTSDNGAANNQSRNTPLTRGKTFIFEGGIRVPFIIKGPGIAPGSRSDQAIVAYDLYATFAALTGSIHPLPTDLDGEDLSPLLLGTGNFIRERPIYFHSPHYETNAAKTPRSAIVEGKYKLIVEYETGNTLLYDLETDISESNDLSNTQPDLTYEMCVRLRDYLLEVGARMPSLDPTHANFSGTGTDVDDDGLDDAWEFQQLLSYTYGPTDDPDGDGISNMDEFTNGTDPYKAAATSVLPAWAKSLKIFPNPTQRWLNIDLDYLPGHETQIKLYSLNGQAVFASPRFVDRIELKDLPTGLYLLELDIAGDRIRKKVMVNP